MKGQTMSDANDDNVIDTRDIAEHIRALAYELEDETLEDKEREEINETIGVYAGTLAEFQQELDRPISESDDLDGMADDFDHLAYIAGGTMVREDYFTEYVQGYLSDIGDLPSELPSYLEIDWEATANNLMVDYTEIQHEGVIYLFR